MLVWRRWIFPILMLLVCGAVAAALVKLAFFPDTAEAAPIEPGGQVTAPTVAVERGDITDELTMSGTIARDDSLTIRSTADGTITKVAIGSGQSVAAGDVLFQVKQFDPIRYIDIVAPEAGDVGEVALVVGQTASLGGELVTLSPARYHVTATIDPVALYRLVGAPTEASVSITGGPAPFACSGLTVSVTPEGTTSVQCAVPGDQQVFAGLAADVTVAVGSAQDVLVLPTTAVAGGSGTGKVWVDTDGVTEEKEVTLGISDGTQVEVTGGLEEGTAVRQYVPGQPADDEPICYPDGMGGEYCESVGMNW